MEEIEITFVVDGLTKDVGAAVGIGMKRAGRWRVMPCPFAVGDLVMYPAQPNLAFRVTYRLYSYGSEAKPPRWILGLERAPHPLGDQPTDGPPRG